MKEEGVLIQTHRLDLYLKTDDLDSDIYPPIEYSRALLETCYGNIQIFWVPESAHIQLKMD